MQKNMDPDLIKVQFFSINTFVCSTNDKGITHFPIRTGKQHTKTRKIPSKRENNQE